MNKPGQRLLNEFYNRNTVEVAKDLLGKRLIVGLLSGIITETEAYRGFDDEASHAFKGVTKRSEIMFGQAGHVYVYMIYGMYYCLNIVTENIGQAGAVLLRGLKLDSTNIVGPGKLCKCLKVTAAHNGIDLLTNKDFYLTSTGLNNIQYEAKTRVGIKKATDKPWRFVIYPKNF